MNNLNNIVNVLVLAVLVGVTTAIYQAEYSHDFVVLLMALATVTHAFNTIKELGEA